MICGNCGQFIENTLGLCPQCQPVSWRVRAPQLYLDEAEARAAKLEAENVQLRAEIDRLKAKLKDEQEGLQPGYFLEGE